MVPSANRPTRRLTLLLGLVLLLPMVATAADPRVAFVTSTSNTGDLSAWLENDSSGLSDPFDLGDHICQVRAEAAGLAAAGVPAFRAWISTTATDAYCHLQGLTGGKDDVPSCGTLFPPGGGPWVLRDGRPVSGDLDSLVDTVSGGPLIPFMVDESGALVSSQNFMTGTYSNGTWNTSDCAGWTNGASGVVVGGRSDSVSVGWSHGSSTSCSSSRRLLCFEQGTGSTPPRPRGPGALVFVTSAADVGQLSLWADAEGLAGVQGGDRVCENLAESAGLPAPEAFVAWLSDSTETAGSRLTIDGPWRRLDGYVVADSKSDLLDGTLDAPILIDESGAPRRSGKTWTGTTVAGGAATARCLEWASASADDTGERGAAVRTSDYWTDFSGTADCDEIQSLYCFANVVTIFWDRFESGDTNSWSNVAP